eukprot:m51a1_g10557 hypothetical protein (623) ;mRNA; f:63364-65555
MPTQELQVAILGPSEAARQKRELFLWLIRNDECGEYEMQTSVEVDGVAYKITLRDSSLDVPTTLSTMERLLIKSDDAFFVVYSPAVAASFAGLESTCSHIRHVKETEPDGVPVVVAGVWGKGQEKREVTEEQGSAFAGARDRPLGKHHRWCEVRDAADAEKALRELVKLHRDGAFEVPPSERRKREAERRKLEEKMRSAKEKEDRRRASELEKQRREAAKAQALKEATERKEAERGKSKREELSLFRKHRLSKCESKLEMRPVEQWSVEDVCTWLRHIGMATYAPAFRKNAISGAALVMLDKAMLSDMGVCVLGHALAILSGAKKLREPPSPAPAATSSPQSPSASTPASTPPPYASTGVVQSTPQTLTGMAGANCHGKLEVGPLVFPNQMKIQQLRQMVRDFAPTKSIVEYLRGKGAELGLPALDAVIEQCESFIDWKIQDENYKRLSTDRGLTKDELLAIALYTFDTGQRQQNLYFVLNNDLRVRIANKMEQWCPFLYFIFSALAKLPAFEGDVYRGVDCSEDVCKQYPKGRQVFWSAFSSTTSLSNVAKDLFAAANGGKGVVFRLSITSGRNIQPLSVIEEEGEILLSPNSCFVVTEGLHDENGTLFVNLLEINGSTVY